MKIRVLMLHWSHTLGGGDSVYLHQLVSLLPAYEVDAHLITIEKHGNGYSLVVHKGREQSEKKFAKSKDVNAYIGNYCDSIQIDLIHIHTLYHHEITAYCLSIRPVIKTPHSTDIVCPGTYKFFSTDERICNIAVGAHCFRHAYTKKCCSRSPARLIALYSNVKRELRRFSPRYKAIVVMSDYLRNECILAGVDEKKIRVIPCFTLPVGTANSSGQNKLLYVGRLSQIKGVHTMIESLAPLFQRYPGLHLDVIGDGPYRNELIELVRRLGLQQRIQFHGWLAHDEVESAMQQCSVLLFPSIYPECFGIAGIEAMMRARPVVGFDVGGVHHWLKNGENGFLVAAKDKTAFSGAVKTLIDDQSLAKRLGEQGRKIALQSFTPDSHITRLVEVYMSN